MLPTSIPIGPMQDNSLLHWESLSSSLKRSSHQPCLGAIPLSVSLTPADQGLCPSCGAFPAAHSKGPLCQQLASQPCPQHHLWDLSLVTLSHSLIASYLPLLSSLPSPRSFHWAQVLLLHKQHIPLFPAGWTDTVPSLPSCLQSLVYFL